MAKRPSRLPALLASGLGIALVAGLIGTGSSQAAEPTVAPAATKTPPTATATMAQLIDQAAVVKPIVTGYSPYKFITVAQRNKKDRLGCNLSKQLLIKAASRKPRVAKGCKITGGIWLADGGTAVVTDWHKVRMTPIFSFKKAWGMGAYAWTPQQRYAWATNVMAPPLTRATGVTPLQATNQIVTAGNLQKILDANVTYTDFLLHMALENSSATGPAAFLAVMRLANSVPGGDYWLKEWAKFIANEKTCASFEAPQVGVLTNAAGWGLGLDDTTWSVFRRTAVECGDIFPGKTWTYELQRAIWGIPAIPSNVVVPNQGSAATSSNGLRVYDNYAAPVTAAVTPSLFGLHAPPDTGSQPQVNYGYLRLWDSAVSWADLNPSKGVYNWTKLQEALASPNAQNKSVMYVLGNTPAWAGDGSPNSAPKDMNDVYDFVKALCGQGGGKITTYEAWNEGNLQTFWKGTQEELAQVTRQVRRALTDCPSGGNVVAASTGTRAEGAFATNYNLYLQELAKLNWPIDGYAVHSYPSASGGPADRLDGVAQFKTMLAANGAPVKPIYDSEVNYGLAGLGQNHMDIDAATSAAYISRTFIDSVRYGIDHVFWFLWTPQYYNKLGVQLNPSTPVQNTAWNQTYSWLVGSRMQRCSDASPQSDATTVVTLCQLTTSAGGNMTLAWTNGKAVTLDTTGLGNDWIGLDGNAGRITGNSLAIGPAPVAIH